MNMTTTRTTELLYVTLILMYFQSFEHVINQKQENKNILTRKFNILTMY